MTPSLDDQSTSTSRAATNTTTTTSKRRKILPDGHQPLLPGLPDHIGQLCLNLVPPSTVYSVCPSWRRVVYTPTFPPFLSLYTLSSDQNSTIQLSSFDPISSKWSVINSLPPSLRRVCLRHPSFVARNLPIQSISVTGNLVFLAGTSKDLLPALSSPIIFNPLTKTWSFGPQLTNPRRWCAAGVSRAAVVVASGISSHYTQTVALSVDKWVFQKPNLFDKKSKDSNGVWKKMRSLSLKGVKFSREAIDAIGYKGKLYMVNLKGAYGKEGIVYDINSDGWSDMPVGMLGGWRGPAAAMDEEIIYLVDELKGVLKKYDDVMEMWVDVLVDERLKGADHIAAGGGRVCVVCGGGGGRILVVDVVSMPPRVSVLDMPKGQQVFGLHILPRMSTF